MFAFNLKTIIIAIIVILVVIILLCWFKKKNLDKQLSSTSSSAETTPDFGKYTVAVQHEVKPEQKVETIAKETIETKSKVEAPILRCHDYFEFPNEGGFHVKTCGARDISNLSSRPTRLFVQWFPVKGASNYQVYLNSGPNVTPNNHRDKTTVPPTSYFHETNSLDGSTCWSLIVTAMDQDGVESEPSKIYTTCN